MKFDLVRLIMRLCILVVLFIGNIADASVVVAEDFVTRAREQSTTFFHNRFFNRLEQAMFIEGYQLPFSSVSTNRALDLGDASHGAFIPSTYANFSQGGDLSGNIIRLDLAQFPELRVTEFILNAGWTLRPIGNSALIIKAHGNVSIFGTIDCSGSAGQNGAALIGTLASGGIGRCGGRAGGSGGYYDGATAHSSQPGSAPPVAGIQAGGGGANSTTVAAGGGGGLEGRCLSYEAI